MDKEIGKVTHYFDKVGVAVVELSDNLNVGDEIHIKGSTTDFTQEVEAMQVEHEDIENARIKFRNGAIANISASRLSKTEMRKIRIFQSDAYISLDYIKQTAAIFRKSARRITKSNIRIKSHDALQEELRSFVNSVQKNIKPAVSGKEATEALRIALEITKQINENSKLI